jgi:hypothetical protein
MGYYKNDTDQPLRIDNGKGRLQRVPAGAVFQADGEYEENVKARGVESCSEDDFKAANPGFSDDTRDRDRMNAVTDANAYATMVANAGLQEVVGDDDAPFGPPTGTITTKHAVMDSASSSVERQAFGPGELTPKEAEGRDLSPVHQKQVDQAAVVDNIAAQAVKGEFAVQSTDIQNLSGSEGARGGRKDAESTERKKPGPKPKHKPAA